MVALPCSGLQDCDGFGSLATVARLQIPAYLHRVNGADFSRKGGKNPCGSQFVKQLPGFYPDQISSGYPTNLIFPSMALYSREHSSINYPQCIWTVYGCACSMAFQGKNLKAT